MTVGGALLQGGRLVARLSVTAASLLTGRKQAVAAFREALIEAGLPEDAVRELSEAYPELRLLKDLARP